MTDVPQSWGVRLRDPQVLAALAHPARLRMLDLLIQMDGATATACAGPVGLSPSACSWHLRQLARAGLVEDAGPGEDGRQRRWRSTVPAWRVEPEGIESGAEAAAALDLSLIRALLAASNQAVEGWAASATKGHESPAWQEAAVISNSTLRLSVEELAELVEQIRALLAPFTLHERPRATSATRAVHVALRAIPISAPPDRI